MLLLLPIQYRILSCTSAKIKFICQAKGNTGGMDGAGMKSPTIGLIKLALTEAVSRDLFASLKLEEKKPTQC